MAEFRVTFKELGQGLKLPAGESHFVTVLTARRVRLTGMFFDLNKCFLLPSAIPGIRAIKSQYDAHPKSSLLIVGHTDTSGSPAYNDPLSVERADAMAAFLTDQTDPWEAFFGDGKPSEKRWGTREVQLMLSVLPEGGDPFFQGDADGKDGPVTQAAVKSFQSSEGLKVDGIAGPATRKALIAKYMALDDTSLPSGITVTTHGCGESFPAAETDDNVRSPEDRRAEIFFFDGPITPPVPAPPKKTSGKTENLYPQWLAQVTDTVDVSSDGPQSGSGTCHFSFILHSDVDGKVLANTPFKIDVPGGPLEGKTDGNGGLQIGDVEPGDFSMVMAGITMFVPSINKSESKRPLRLRSDVSEA